MGGGCVPFVCRGPDDCGAGEICSGGSCITPPPPPAVDRVSILSPGGVILEGETRTLVAVAYDAAGNAIVGAPIQWSSDAPDSVSVSADGVATGGSTPGTATLTASFSGESDTVTLTLLPPAPAGRRVVVVDAEDGSLISGALVRLEPDGLEATTDADGVAVFAAGGPSDVHVFSDAHDYVTIAQNTADDLLVALPRRTRSDRAGGITGGILFDRVRTQGEISVGLAGLSLGQSLPDVDLVSLMGEVFVIHLDFGGQTQDVPLPGGMVAEAEFNGFPFSIKNRFYARGRDGLRAAWAFAGRLSFDRFSGGGSATARLSRILPLFSLFEHGLVPRILVSEMDTVVDTGDIDGDGDTTERVPDWNAFPARNLTPAQTQTLRVHVDPPAMPTYQGAPTDAVVLLAGNRLGRLGLLPLGLSATELPQNGGTEAPPVTMKLAPVYGGLEAGVYQLLALAVPFGDTSSGNFDAPREASVRVVTATTLPPDLQLDSFLPFASGSYDAASRTLQADAVPGASLTRFVLAAPEGRWIVYGQGALSETLPAPPAGFADLAAEATASVSPIQLRSDLSADNLLSPAGPTLVDLDTVTTAYSRVNLP
ncbi:MAG: Ig-like domain-containing protein [Deltaproteobacteria bacterium]|nr:MAG: Ig-like domain-containing protein [Deltaproteobacteria bacterium]